MTTINTYRNVSKELRHAVDEYHLRVNDCQSCPLHDLEGRSDFLSTRTVFRGNLPADVVLVFPAPRRVDVLSDSPLRGVEGSVIDEIVNAVLGFYPRLRVCLITAVHCYPYHDELDHRDPTKQEIHTCFHANVSKLLEMAKPSLIVLFGETMKKYFPQVSPTTTYVTVKHPTSAIKSRTLDYYKRDVFYAIDKVLDKEGAVFICNKKAKFTPGTK